MSLVEKLGLFVFDLDGTLIKTYREYYDRQFSLAFEHFGLKKDMNLFRRLWFDDKRSEIVSKLGVDPKKFWEYYHSIENLDYRKENISLYDNKDRHFMKKLSEKGKKIALVTGTSGMIMDLEVNFFGKGFFDACYSTYDVRLKKNILIADCIKKLNSETDRCIYVGNSDRDVTESRIAGVKSIIVDRRECFVKERPDYRVKSLNDILKLP